VLHTHTDINANQIRNIHQAPVHAARHLMPLPALARRRHYRYLASY
jgi:hypothetical protein